MRVLSIVGNRPQFIKSAALSLALREAGITETVVHTGQHYDPGLSDVFFEELGLPEPAYRLGLRTSDPALMTPHIEEAVRRERPDWVLVYGDTNSTLAGAEAAGGVPVAHVESGLRSFDMSMPEEHNRIAVDRIAALLLCPDERSAAQLESEGVPGRREVVGDVMADAARIFGPIARERSRVLERLGLEPGGYAVATVHRQANVTEDERLQRIVEGLQRVSGPTRVSGPPADPGSPRPARARAADDSAARLPRLRRPRLERPGDPHRLGRASERGVLVWRPVRDDEAVDGMGRHGRGGGQHPRRRRSRRDRGSSRLGAHAGGAPRALRRRVCKRSRGGRSVRLATVSEHIWDVGIIGAGYVGVPLAQTFAAAGKRVLLVDAVPELVEALNQGESHIEDVPTSELRPHVDAGRIAATLDYGDLSDAHAIMIALPTPLTKQREPDLSYVTSAARALAPVLRAGQIVVLESTTYPGTTREVLLPILEQGSGLKAGTDFHLAMSPERVDPGRTDWTTKTTPKVLGGLTPACGEAAAAVYRAAVDTVHIVSTPEAAELTKLLENIFRSVNIALVNELAQLCDRMDIDVWEVIGAAATKPFGFMPFQPGPGLGGHCIPLDPFYLSWKAREYDFTTRFIDLSGEVNNNMPYFCRSVISQALNHGLQRSLSGSRVLVLGVAYKADIADTRETPAEKLIHLLRNAGAEVAYHDPHVPVFDGMTSTLLKPEDYDCVAIVTAHSAVDYADVISHAKVVVDFRNATKGLDGEGKVWKL